MKIPGIFPVLLLAFVFGVTGIGAGQAGAAQAAEAEFLKTRRIAEHGDANAQFQLGAMYELGLRGAPKDETIAAEWYRKAAEQGDPRAQHSLGHMYQHGRGGLRQDKDTAMEWYAQAAEQGHLGARKNLDAMLGEQEDGQETPRRYSKKGPRGM